MCIRDSNAEYMGNQMRPIVSLVRSIFGRYLENPCLTSWKLTRGSVSIGSRGPPHNYQEQYVADSLTDHNIIEDFQNSKTDCVLHLGPNQNSRGLLEILPKFVRRKGDYFGITEPLNESHFTHALEVATDDYRRFADDAQTIYSHYTNNRTTSNKNKENSVLKSEYVVSDELSITLSGEEINNVNIREAFEGSIHSLFLPKPRL
eukprot:TRINITY_DN11537_c0_g3_i2.p1 TRINITY_DN11537_c0_g3~~TRINITY_DN11537_c0_g3_i2.p1  ORF type:complete len:204 (-),score=7.99 TRINITY_DN11537_c0_g3_i2:213-824(-)